MDVRSSTWHPKRHLGFAAEEARSSVICNHFNLLMKRRWDGNWGATAGKNSQRKKILKSKSRNSRWTGGHSAGLPESVRGQIHSTSRAVQLFKAVITLGLSPCPGLIPATQTGAWLHQSKLWRRTKEETAYSGKRCMRTSSFGEDLSFEKIFGENPKRPSRYTHP